MHVERVGAYRLASDEPVPGAAALDPTDARALLDAAAMAAPGRWLAAAEPGLLHVHAIAAAPLPPDAGGSDPLWEIARALAPPDGRPLRATIARGAGALADAVAVVVPLGQDASAALRRLTDGPAEVRADAADAAHERLSDLMRRADPLRRRGELVACAVAFKGRGRVAGPLRPDLLIRFGVSSWR